MKLSATVTAEFGQADGAQEAALDAGLSLLWRLASEREGLARIDQTPITLADTGTDGVENWTLTGYDESEILCVFDKKSIPARAG